MTVAIVETDWITDLYAAHHRQVLGFFTSRLSSRECAEDLAADVFVRLCASSERYRDHPEPAALVMTVARNLLTDHYRGAWHNRVRAVGLDVGTHLPAAPANEPGEDFLDMTRSLPPIWQQVLVLTVGYGLQTAEAGEVLGIPATTVRSMRFRAFRRLKDQPRSEVLG